MLRALSGRTHVVHTGVAVAADGETSTANTSSEVTFASLTDDDIEWYLGTGEPFDKAGAYALQGAGGVFVTRFAAASAGSSASRSTRRQVSSGTSISTLGSGC